MQRAKLYDEFTQQLARGLPLSVEDVDRAVALLAAAGASATDAKHWLGHIVQGHCSLDVALGAAQLGARPGPA